MYCDQIICASFFEGDRASIKNSTVCSDAAPAADGANCFVAEAKRPMSAAGRAPGLLKNLVQLSPKAYLLGNPLSPAHFGITPEMKMC